MTFRFENEIDEVFGDAVLHALSCVAIEGEYLKPNPTYDQELKDFGLGSAERIAREMNEDYKDHIEDIQWAYAVLIARSVVKFALRETDETSDQPTSKLLKIAREKIQNDSYVAVVAEYLVKKGEIPSTADIDFDETQKILKRSFREIRRKIEKNVSL